MGTDSFKNGGEEEDIYGMSIVCVHVSMWVVSHWRNTG